VSLVPRAVLVHRRTEYEELLARHGTRGQAAFFLSTRGRDIQEVEARHAAEEGVMAAVAAAIPLDWRRGVVERADLSRFLFDPEDVIVVVGQDGLVANAAKYLNGQVVVGINTDPGRNPGVLVPHPAAAAEDLLHAAVRPDVEASVEARTMVEGVIDDGQRICALNELYVGQPSHQTARYTLRDPGGDTERQASSGLVIATGTGATGWSRSIWLERHTRIVLPTCTDPALAWFVREAWPSPATGVDLTEGLLAPGEELSISVESDRLVTFGDGIEADAVSLSWGQTIAIRTAARRLRLLR
jgi:hypothetical protein